MCIGLLLAGQHTSSTTSAWLGFFLAQNKEIQVGFKGQVTVKMQKIFKLLWKEDEKELHCWRNFINLYRLLKIFKDSSMRYTIHIPDDNFS